MAIKSRMALNKCICIMPLTTVSDAVKAPLFYRCIHQQKQSSPFFVYSQTFMTQ